MISPSIEGEKLTGRLLYNNKHVHTHTHTRRPTITNEMVSTRTHNISNIASVAYYDTHNQR